MEELILALKRLLMNDVIPLRQADAEVYGSKFRDITTEWNPLDFRDFAAFVNTFSSRLFVQWLETNKKSGMVSGAGLALLLTIVDFLSEGITKKEIRETMGSGFFPSPALIQKWLEAMEHSDRMAKIQIKNGLWYHEGIQADQEIRGALKTMFQTGGSPQNFSSERSVNIINRWAKEMSVNRIPSLIELLKGNMIFAQIVNIRGVWQYPFEKLSSRADLFYSEDGPVSIPMMRTEGTFPFLKSDLWDSVFLPLGQNLLTLIVSVPAKGKNLEEMPELFFSGEYAAKPNIRAAAMRVVLPVVSLHTLTDFGFLLKKMGLLSGFDPDTTDFRRFSPEPLWLDQLVQGVSFEINETGVGDNRFARTQINFKPIAPESEQLIIDRPFYLKIVENNTGMILLQGIFMGKD
ncbi:MAG: serpin family protein [Bacteroidia bacterium]